ILINEKVDTLIVVDSINCFFTCIAAMGLNIYHICWEHFNLKVNLGSKFRDIGRWMAVRWCDKIVTLTERDKKFWENHFNITSKNKVVAINNPSSYILQNNIPKLENKKILCVGRLTHQKGFDLLLTSWSKVSSKMIGWELVIVGDGEDKIKLEKQAINLGIEKTVIFAGQQKDVRVFYENASFFCMSSRYEGLPMVLLEAQSYNLPIVSFDCNTGPAEVIIDGLNGYLVDHLDIKELSESLLKMASLTHFDYSLMISNSSQNVKR
ncbi:glycosyltransferase, partial [Acinetobacter ursingii]|uniref:glycosyltransferase n=1 Tax=Acinetobacter ursingii TaxID=108980 RepID=UPI00313E86E2